VAPQGATVAVEPYWLYHQEVTIHSSMAINQSYARAVELAGRGVLPEAMVSATLTLAQYPEAIARIRRGEGLKVQIAP
jgi:threonine dehydrogenase-like Zn-dependent dehydrogenase